MAERTHRDEGVTRTIYEDADDARLAMSHSSQHCLQKAEGQSFGTTSVQEYSAHDQCAQVSDSAEGAQTSDGAEGARVSDGAEGAQTSDGAEGAQALDGAEGAQTSDGAEGARVSDDAEDVERVRLLAIQLSTK